MVRRIWMVACVAGLAMLARAEEPQAFDGRPWNVSSGNASVTFIQASPVGAFPKAGVTEAPPAAEVLRRMKAEGLVAYEDYVAWGAVERAEGQWDWSQHDRMEAAMHAAGLKYVVYDWVHFPPKWLRDSAERRCAPNPAVTVPNALLSSASPSASPQRAFRKLARCPIFHGRRALHPAPSSPARPRRASTRAGALPTRPSSVSARRRRRSAGRRRE